MMIVRLNNCHMLVAAATLALPSAAFAASDVSNSGSLSRQAVTAVAAPIASSQTASLISGAISGAISGGAGGFAPSGGVGGGFAPSSGSGPQSSLPLMSTRGMAGGGAASKFGVWTQGTYSYIDRAESGLEMSGHAYNLVAGADYKVTDTFLAGLALAWEYSDLDTDFNRGTFSGSGISAVPYIGITLTPNWTMDLSGGYGWLSYDSDRNNGAITGNYNARRTFATGNLTGSFAHNNWRFQPKAGVSYIHEFQDSYTESNGAAVDSDTIEFGRLSGGTKIGYAVGNSVPYIKVMAEWDFLRPDAVLKSNGQASSTSDGGGVIGLGYEIYSGGFIGSVEANYNSLFREDLDLYTVALRARYAF